MGETTALIWTLGLLLGCSSAVSGVIADGQCFASGTPDCDDGDMKFYVLDRTGGWCDLAGVNNRPGVDQQVTNNNSSGVAGDYLRFTWSF